MLIDRGLWGTIPFAAVGAGPPLVVLPGLSTVAGSAGEWFVRGSFAPVRNLSTQRRLILLNRWPGMPAGLSMGELAAAHADAIRDHADGPVDLVGMSTGGSIAQQLAADHPGIVRRLVLISTACRLGPVGRTLQGRVADLLRQGDTRGAIGSVARSLAPRGLAMPAAGLGWLLAHRILRSRAAADDLITTIEAEDGFDLVRCRHVIDAPTLIVAGGRDRFYEPDLFAETASLIPRSRLGVFPERGHVGVAGDREAIAAIGGFIVS